MVSTLLPLVSLLGIFPLASIAAELTQAEANARCQEKFNGYIAVRNEKGEYITCIPPPPPLPANKQVCFGGTSTDPKSGTSGCCPAGVVFSFNKLAKRGGCCPKGSTFSWDSAAQKGACCSGDCEFKCSCRPKAEPAQPTGKPKPAPMCPAGNGQTWKTGGKTFKLSCGKYYGGASISACETQPSRATCATKCAGIKACTQVDWYQKKCCYKSGKAAPKNIATNIDNWFLVAETSSTCALTYPVGVTPAKPAQSPSTPNIPAPTCPSGNGKTWKTAGKTYKLFCGKYIGASSIIPCEAQPRRDVCATKCAKVVGCHSVDWYQNKCCYKTKDTAPVDSLAGIDSWLEVSA